MKAIMLLYPLCMQNEIRYVVYYALKKTPHVAFLWSASALALARPAAGTIYSKT